VPGLPRDSRALDRGFTTPMRKFFLRHKDRGATAVEYGLMVALIAAVIVTIVGLLGGGIQTAFDTVCDKVVSGGCTP